MAKDFIRILNAKRNGRCDDSCLLAYIDGVDALIRKVYNYRYKGAWRPQKRNKLGEEHSFGTERGGYEFIDGRLRVEPETFSNKCWEQLEDHGLLKIVCDRNFDDDDEMYRYLYTSFNHTLQEMILKLAPGSGTRYRQINIILNNFCRKTTLRGRICWVLNKLSDDDVVPAGLDRLMAILDEMTIPDVKYPANPDSLKGPAVSREAMRGFLHELIPAVGGAVFRSDLLDLINRIFSLISIQKVGPRGKGGESGTEPSWEGFASGLRFTQETFYLGQSHTLMAVELFAKLDDRMKDVYYFRNILKIGVTDTAKRLDCSIGTISNTGKAIDQTIFDYFYAPEDVDEKDKVDPGCSSLDEIEGVKKLLEQLIIREKEHE